MSKITVTVPDIGGAEEVDVIDVAVKVGDIIAVDQDLITLETDKASMDVPSSHAGKVVEILIKVGDKANEGTAILVVETEGDAAEPAPAPVAAATPAAPVAAPAAAPVTAGGTRTIELTVPDLGGADEVTVIELCVAPGTKVSAEESLIVLESDKASMDLPAPQEGTIVRFTVAVDSKVKEGDVYAVMEVGASASAAAPAAVPAAAPAAAPAAVPAAAPAAASTASADIELPLPDLGGVDSVTVIELCVAPGTAVKAEESLIVLESDKASMDVPAPADGVLVGFKVAVGDKVSQGDLYAVFRTGGATAAPVVAQAAAAPVAAPAPVAAAAPSPVAAAPAPVAAAEEPANVGNIYAGPSSRRMARQLGVDLTKVKGTGIRGRITKDDIRDYVRAALIRAEKAPVAAPAAVTGGSGIPPIPAVDFAQFGEIEMVKMSKIKKVTAANMTRAWLNVPHVTQFDDADITDLEAFRASMKAESEKAGVKLTPLPFLIKAAAMALRAEPSFNVSLHHDGEHIVQKNYVHIGIACDTPNGLMVPVLRDADKKGIYQIAKEANELVKAARDGKLKPRDMQGGCFTISSLGAMGGNGFTPIVNAPEVAILGVSRAQMKPVWNGKEFVPRNMLPLAVSYDHRAINGADCGRFFTTLVALIGDIRRILL